MREKSLDPTKNIRSYTSTKTKECTDCIIANKKIKKLQIEVVTLKHTNKVQSDMINILKEDNRKLQGKDKRRR